MFLAGIANAKAFLLYILLTEISPKEYQVYVGAYCVSVDTGVALIPTTIFFLAGGKDINHIVIIGLVFSVVGFIVSFLYFRVSQILV